MFSCSEVRNLEIKQRMILDIEAIALSGLHFSECERHSETLRNVIFYKLWGHVKSPSIQHSTMKLYVVKPDQSCSLQQKSFTPFIVEYCCTINLLFVHSRRKCFAKLVEQHIYCSYFQNLPNKRRAIDRTG